MDDIYNAKETESKVSENFNVIISEFEKEGTDILKNKFTPILKKFGVKGANEKFTSYVLLGMLSSIALSDGVLVEKEINFMRTLFPEGNIEDVLEYFKEHPFNLNEIKNNLNQTQLTIIFILAWQIALSDGHLDESEKAYLNKIKDTFSLDENDIRDYKMLLFAKLVR